MPIYENRRNAENFVTFSEADLQKIICGCSSSAEAIAAEVKPGTIVYCEAWYGTVVSEFAAALQAELVKAGKAAELISAAGCFKPADVIAEQKHRWITDEPAFGRVNENESLTDYLDAAGVEKGGLASPVAQGAVGVAEEKEVKIFLLRGVAGRHERILYTVGVAVAQQHPQTVPEHQFFRRLTGTEIAVAGYLLHGEPGKEHPQFLCIPPAVPQMDDEVGFCFFHGPGHGLHITVGVGEHQNGHG